MRGQVGVYPIWQAQLPVRSSSSEFLHQVISLIVLPFRAECGLDRQYVVFNAYVNVVWIIPRHGCLDLDVVAFQHHIQGNRPFLNLCVIFGIGVGSPSQTVHVFMDPAQCTKGSLLRSTIALVVLYLNPPICLRINFNVVPM